MRYPADPPTVEEIVAVMRQAGDGVHALRMRALIAVLWRAGLRIDEALHLAEPDLDESRGSLIVRHGKGGKRREVGMDDWGWEHVRLWASRRAELPVGPLFCVIEGRPADAHGRRVRRGCSCDGWRRKPGFGGGSLRINCAGFGGGSLRINCATPTLWS